MSVQQRVRYHQYMRPRYSNPTYLSNNVGSTMGLLFAPQSLVMPKVSAYVDNNIGNPVSNYNNSAIYESKPSPKQQPSQVQNKMQLNKRSNSQSNLSNYGTKSLGKLQKLNDQNQISSPSKNIPKIATKFIDERDIYQKQKKNYNIISIQPLEYGNETIKKYSKYRLQNKDQNYYKNLKLQEEYRRPYHNAESTHHPDRTNLSNYHQNNGINNSEVYQRFSSNPELNNVNMTNSMLHNGGNYDNKPVQQFRPKMLNNIDQLGGVL